MKRVDIIHPVHVLHNGLHVRNSLVLWEACKEGDFASDSVPFPEGTGARLVTACPLNLTSQSFVRLVYYLVLWGGDDSLGFRSRICGRE